MLSLGEAGGSYAGVQDGFVAIRVYEGLDPRTSKDSLGNV